MSSEHPTADYINRHPVPYSSTFPAAIFAFWFLDVARSLADPQYKTWASAGGTFPKNSLVRCFRHGHIRLTQLVVPLLGRSMLVRYQGLLFVKGTARCYTCRTVIVCYLLSYSSLFKMLSPHDLIQTLPSFLSLNHGRTTYIYLVVFLGRTVFTSIMYCFVLLYTRSCVEPWGCDRSHRVRERTIIVYHLLERFALVWRRPVLQDLKCSSVY
jgi:hypothetical protein